ncbi:MAG: hypothetical protein DSZ18_03530 [Candidatus Thioglobus sp.]|jgi:hypothetical protein|uniref:Uncharacterized protein n=1 Tax=hydrothermal vent metagenome TaxID=652676 RepID=A0A1W1DUS6_9ZZZZ|nr:MAG: hypothetical protein DSZ13_02710 [Candidatus Thioglobus sp.]RUM83193.1 MAG: hypothetical protein DSZ18_03530 [Candidatus Thioglobus sp.]
MKLMIMINTIALALLLAATSASAEASKPYGVFNPLAMFDLVPRTPMQRADSAFYNYGNKGYDFVVEALPMPVVSVPHQVASLDKR